MTQTFSYLQSQLSFPEVHGLNSAIYYCEHHGKIFETVNLLDSEEALNIKIVKTI